MAWAMVSPRNENMPPDPAATTTPAMISRLPRATWSIPAVPRERHPSSVPAARAST